MQKHASRLNKHYLQNDFSKIKGAFVDATQDVGDKMSDLITHSIKDMKSKSLGLRDNTSDFIAHKPFKSLAVATLTGFVIGFLLKKNSK